MTDRKKPCEDCAAYVIGIDTEELASIISRSRTDRSTRVVIVSEIRRRNKSEAKHRRKRFAPPPATVFQKREQPITMQETFMPETPATAGLELPPEIAAAMMRLNETTNAVLHIRKLTAAARADREIAARDHAEAFGQLAESEAAVLLDGAAAAAQSLRKAVERHQQSLMGIEARIAGLAARERAAAGECDKAILELSARLDEWVDSEKARARGEFQEALDKFNQEAAQPIAVGIALGDSRLATVARNGSIPNCRDEHNGFNSIRFYHANPLMAETITVYSGVRQACRAAIESAAHLTAAQAAQQKPA